MRLYTRTGATALTDPATGIVYEADEHGGFDFPDDLSDQLHRFAVRGKPMWESDVEQQNRLGREEMARRRDPASLYDAVAQLMSAAQSVQAVSVAPADAEVTAPVVKQPRKRAASKPAAPAE